jgi:hypothetical protein
MESIRPVTTDLLRSVTVTSVPRSTPALAKAFQDLSHSCASWLLMRHEPENRLSFSPGLRGASDSAWMESGPAHPALGAEDLSLHLSSRNDWDRLGPSAVDPGSSLSRRLLIEPNELRRSPTATNSV